MQLQQANKRFLALLLILGLFIAGLEAVENQKGKQDTSGDYDEDVSLEPDATSPTTSPADNPSFAEPEVFVHATHEGANITLNCQPKNFDESKHVILWYRNGTVITTGNNTIVLGDFALDSKYRLVVFNYTKSTPYNFACSVEPGHASQKVTIVFHPPDNISEHSAAVGHNYLASYFQVAAITFILLMTANAWN